VIVRQIVSGRPPRIFAGFTNKAYYFTQIGFSIIPKKNVTAGMITGILNSNLLNFIHKYLYLDIEKELFQKVLIQNCKKLPIPTNDSKNLINIENIVMKINKIKSEDPTADTTSLEQEIDQIVYELYGLTEEEIEIVEGGVGGYGERNKRPNAYQQCA
jgi:hypothetical protein